ncbi:MAG: DNA primase, partial [Hydrogenophaga sp.]|nr:DNA primase [Hydrogenophaga sp.]
CTPDHVQKLFRFTDSVVFSFDGDGAGRRAARKALDAALPLATDTRSVKFLFLPAEHDPDSFIRANGEAAFAKCVKEAMPLSRFLIESASADCDLTALPDGALKRQLIGDLAEGIGLGAADLLQLWQQHNPQSRPRRGTPPGNPAPTHDTGSTGPAGQPYPPYEDVGHLTPAYGATTSGSVYGYRNDVGNPGGSGYGTPAGFGQRRNGKYRREAPPPRMLGSRKAVASRADRAVGLLLASPQAWDSLTADDHSLLAHLPVPHGPVVSWLEAQFHEHGAQPWAALREALRGHEHEVWACSQVEQVLLGGDADTELTELAGVMALLRVDALTAQADSLARRVQAGDTAAFDEFKRVNDRLKALKTTPLV